MHNLTLSLSAQYPSKKKAIVTITLKNNMGKDCYIPSLTIMLNNQNYNKFIVTQADNNRQILPSAHKITIDPSYTLIKNSNILQNQVDLAKFYHFQEFGEYYIEYETYTHCCQNINGTQCDALREIFSVISTVIHQDTLQEF